MSGLHYRIPFGMSKYAWLHQKFALKRPADQPLVEKLICLAIQEELIIEQESCPFYQAYA